MTRSYITTLCLKKVPTFKLSVTLSHHIDLNRFSKFVHCWKAYEICYKTLQHYPSHLGKLKTQNFLQIFSRYERKCKQTAFLSPLTLLFIHKF